MNNADTFDTFQPGDRVRFRAAPHHPHVKTRPGLHYVYAAERPNDAGERADKAGFGQWVFLIGLQNNLQHWKIGQYYPIDLELVHRAPLIPEDHE